jgi:hypothetical protein
MTHNALIVNIAERRAAIHAGHASSRPLSDGYENVGLAGEVAFGMFCGQCPDFSERPGGDKGIDFVVPLLYTVDVKTARNAGNLIHEAGKKMPADIYVLAEYGEDGAASLVGWEWRQRLMAAPTKDFGYGIVNHYIQRTALRPMGDMARRIWKAHS